MATNSRLSPYEITDDLVRAELYREIRTGAPGWTEYTINPDEALFPELVSQRAYGIDQLKWCILIAAGIDNMRERLPVGSTIKLPPIVWVRQRIKYYSERV